MGFSPLYTILPNTYQLFYTLYSYMIIYGLLSAEM